MTRPDEPKRPVNAMTVDVEDYFQVSAFADVVKRSDWERIDGRVEAKTLELLDEFDRSEVRCTFFVLGWIAERYPDLVRAMAARGHEIASHGYDHTRVTDQSEEEFRIDIRRSKAILEDISGQTVNGFRAASFSIEAANTWAHEVLADEGYLYSSSVYPVLHDHYGSPDAPRFAYRPNGDNGVVEIPMSTVRLLGRNIPCAGGGYFRLLPYAVYSRLLGRVHSADRRPTIFYTHPWEFDPAQPRQAGLGFRTRFRHYVNLSTTKSKLRALLAEFAWDRMDKVFLAEIEGETCSTPPASH